MEIMFGDYRVKPRERELLGPAGAVELSARSFDLLQALLGKPGELVDKAELFDIVWPGVVVEENTLQVHMSALRKALGPGFIATVHGRGYKYVGPEPQQVAAAMPMRRVASSEGNIVRYRAECVARDAEAEAVRRLIEQHRLVSIVGPGGVGKTTLAIAVAGALPPPAGGVWMVDLASINDGQFIESMLIQTLGVPFRAGAVSLDSILDYLRGSDAVLVFDNCEHVRGAAARVARTLLAEAPGLRILATSQIPLGLGEEHVFKLLPFAVGEGDEADEAASAKFLAHCYEIFGESLSPEERPLVARLCRRLDGVALAIKMAAARAAMVGIETVDRQLEQQLATLEADWDPQLARHRSLAASLAWSYDLLPVEQQRVLRSLGVFHGSFSLDAINAVAGEGAEASVAELLRRSLVVREGQDRSRYRLLDSTRHFALDKLAEAGEDLVVQQRHAAWVAAHFAEGIEKWETMPDDEWVRLYRPDGGNLRAALAWTRARADWPTYVEIAAASYRYFIEEQLGTEGIDTIEAGMALVGAVPAQSAARLRLALGEMGRFNAMDIRARQGLEPALDYFRQSDDQLRYVQSLVLLSWITIFFREHHEATPLVAELDTLLPVLPLSKVKAWGLVASGLHAWAKGLTTAGLARAEAGLAMHLDAGNHKGRIRSSINLCEMLHRFGDTERAARIAGQIVPEVRQHGSRLQISVMPPNIAAYNFALDQLDAAETALREAAEVVPRDGSHWHWCLLQGVAELYVRRGAASEAAMLLGYTDRCFDGWQDGRQDTEKMQRVRILTLLAASMPAEERDRLMLQGRSLSLFEADRLAGYATAERGLLQL